MKQLKWVVKDSQGKVLERCATRDGARESRQWYLENLFEAWIVPLTPPLKIIREEWELVGEKVVR